MRNQPMSKIVMLVVLLFSTVAANAQNVSVADFQKIFRQAGEAQSTVVPPGVNGACTNGRFLVSIDLLRPPSTGLVVGRDLDNPAGSEFPMCWLSAGHDSERPFRT